MFIYLKYPNRIRKDGKKIELISILHALFTPHPPLYVTIF